MPKIYMFFMLREGWHCQFLKPDLKTTAAPPRTFSRIDLVEELATRGKAFSDLASKQAFAYATTMGRGSVWLTLTDEQYVKLCNPKPAKRR